MDVVDDFVKRLVEQAAKVSNGTTLKERDIVCAARVVFPGAWQQCKARSLTKRGYLERTWW